MNILEELRKVQRLRGDTYSSAEVVGLVGVARDALTRIKAGTIRAEWIAEDALTDMMPLDPKYPLQGVVGHGERR